MRFLIGVVCVISLFEAVYAQDRCEACKDAVATLKNLQEEITEISRRDAVREQDSDRFPRSASGPIEPTSRNSGLAEQGPPRASPGLIWTTILALILGVLSAIFPATPRHQLTYNFALSESIMPVYAQHRCEACKDALATRKDLQEEINKSPEKICEALDFCPSHPIQAPYRFRRYDFAEVAEDAEDANKMTEEILNWLFSPLRQLLPGRRKRDLASAERNMAGIYGEDEDNLFMFTDPTLNPSSELPKEMDEYMRQAASSLKCELCKLGISIDSSNTTLLQTGQDAPTMRQLLCRPLPEKGNQRKCGKLLRQALEIFLQVLGSIFDSLETCEGLKSCQVG